MNNNNNNRRALNFGTARWAWRCLLVVLAAHHARASTTNCSLPDSWRGRWFHSGVAAPVVITAKKIDFKGICTEQDRDRFLLKDPKHNCYRCLVVHQRHYNVLQYKETFCDTTGGLANVCDMLTGDSLLNSLFRLDAQPIPCPFPDSYTFTYARGHSECAYPLSTVDSCTVEHKMLFRYQACPDVQGTESTQEELVCLGKWREGSNNYLVGKSDNPRATSDEDRYQCFVFKEWSKGNNRGYHVAQSGDATCNGLYSIYGGSMRLVMQRMDPSGSRCNFPIWVEGGYIWHSLDSTTTLHVSRRNHTLRLKTPERIVTHSCLMPYAHTRMSATYVTKVVHGCTSGYQCVHMIARDEPVLEIIMGKVTPVSSAACNRNNFNASSTDFTTFVSSRAESRQCPGVGRYEVVGGVSESSVSGEDMGVAALGVGTGGSSNGFPLYSHDDEVPLREQCVGGPFTHLAVGCKGSDKLILSNQCSSAEYSCHGSWEDSGRQYLVVTPTSRSSKGVRRLCLVLERGVGVMSLASSTRSCGRDLTPGLHGHMALNTTSTGGCDPTPQLNGSGSTSIHSSATLLLVLLLPHLLQRLVLPASSF